MLTLVASAPSTDPLAGIAGILILLQKASAFSKEGRKPRCSLCLLGAQGGQPVRTFFPCLQGGDGRGEIAHVPGWERHPVPSLLGGRTHPAQLSHSSTTLLHPTPSPWASGGLCEAAEVPHCCGES